MTTAPGSKNPALSADTRDPRAVAIRAVRVSTDYQMDRWGPERQRADIYRRIVLPHIYPKGKHPKGNAP